MQAPLTKTKRRSRQAGVTLIEMLVVVTIIALFAALVAPTMLKHGDKARVVAARSQIQNFSTALGSFKLDTSQYPAHRTGPQQPCATALATFKTGTAPTFPQDVPNDPWGHPYIYKYPGDHGDEPDISSFGADGAPGGDGINADIFSWSNK